MPGAGMWRKTATICQASSTRAMTVVIHWRHVRGVGDERAAGPGGGDDEAEQQARAGPGERRAGQAAAGELAGDRPDHAAEVGRRAQALHGRAQQGAAAVDGRQHDVRRRRALRARAGHPGRRCAGRRPARRWRCSPRSAGALLVDRCRGGRAHRLVADETAEPQHDPAAEQGEEVDAVRASNHSRLPRRWRWRVRRRATIALVSGRRRRASLGPRRRRRSSRAAAAHVPSAAGRSGSADQPDQLAT